jgi:hypothetical protein
MLVWETDPSFRQRQFDPPLRALPFPLPTLLDRQPTRVPQCAMSSAGLAVAQSRREVLTGIIGARRAWTVSMISALSIP